MRPLRPLGRLWKAELSREKVSAVRSKSVWLQENQSVTKSHGYGGIGRMVQLSGPRPREDTWYELTRRKRRRIQKLYRYNSTRQVWALARIAPQPVGGPW